MKLYDNTTNEEFSGKGRVKMVTKVMPAFRLERTNRDPRSATDSTKKKSHQSKAFKEVLLKSW
jgi:hypothetical protein